MVLRIFRHFVPASIVLLAVVETVIIFLAWYFYLADHSLSTIRFSDLIESPTLRLSLLAGVAMVLTGLYNNKAFVDFRIMVSQIAVSFVFLCPIALAGALYWQNALGPDTSFWEIFRKAGFSWLVCILFTRVIFLTLADLNLFKMRVVVLGTGKKAARIAALVSARRNRNFVPMAYLPAGNDPVAVGMAATDIDFEDPEALAHRVRDLRAREIVVATDDRRGLPASQLLHCRMAGTRVIDFLDFIERETKTVDLAALQPGWLIFSDGFRGGCGLARASKRCLDIILSTLLLLLTLPLMLLTCLLITLESSGSVLYRQERVGFAGRTFVLLKFRSMRADAEKDGAPRWAATKDPRVTRVGHLIRKLRIDELPQLLNVLRGDMSFVGPRPERPAFVDEFIKQVPYYAERHCVKPGITGWAQINYPYGASLEDARNKLSYDLYYVKNRGLFLDLVIVLQTVRVILWADGAR